MMVMIMNDGGDCDDDDDDDDDDDKYYFTKINYSFHGFLKAGRCRKFYRFRLYNIVL